MEDENVNLYFPLYKATIHGDWITAKRIFDSDSNSLTANILALQETALHVSIGAGHSIEFVQEHVDRMEVRTIKQDFWCRFANAKGTAMVQVEKVVQLSYKEMQNKDRKSPRQVFTGKHENLVEKGDKWMKDTASSCATVAALVVTVVFAAAFTVPGGNNSDLGIPVYLKETSFMIFAVLDALGLFSSSTSLLMFLGILTSCYSEEDFLKALPMRLSIGLITLFFSIASMLTAFTAAFHLVLFHRVKWITIPIGLIASAPVTLFALL
ncbi:hypothetical protein GH714_005510 [Hevea brasiliensis]|uniref:PGG domain-containing protein n=1 Tax=Hevea brasiliensis TaxID=3981 RepID=A0A6A6NBN3_HEVBR|nr:hypothetical protein GH714_005510 [Hevea brasiliensis]